MWRQAERDRMIFCGLGMIVALLAVFAPVSQAQDTPEIQESEAAVTVELGFGSGIDRETRALVEPGTEFPAGIERIYCRMHIVGAQAPTTVTHAWYRDGKTMAEVELNVGSGNWRTWSSKRLLPDWTGYWEVKVLDQAGKVLASSSFEVK
jgi:hypothetical protein